MMTNEIEMLRKLSAHMEEDAYPDEVLLTKENIHNIFILATSVSKLLTHIDSQAEQIVALKEIAISLYVKSMEECNGECGKHEWKPETCDDCEHEYARNRLEAEYPEAMR